MTRTRRFLNGLGVGYAGQIVLAIVGLFVTRFLLGHLGQHDYGLWLVGTQLLSYLMLSDIGIVALLPREVAYATGRESSARPGPALFEVVGETARIVLWQTPLVALAAAILWMLLPTDWNPLRSPLGIVLCVFVVTFPLRILPQTLRGVQDLAMLGIILVSSQLAGALITVLLVVQGWGLYAIAAGWALTQVLISLSSFARLRRRFPETLPSSWPRLTAQAVRDRFGRGIWVSMSQMAVVLLNGTDVVIIANVMGAAAVVPYVCTTKLIGFLANQPQMLMQTAEVGLSQMKTSESRSSLSRVANALTRSMLIASGVIVCGVLVMNHGFVRLWVGESQWGGLTLTALVLFRTLLGHWDVTSASAIFAFGYERRLAWVGVVTGLLTVGLSVVLVRWLGLIGAPVASLVAVLLVSLPANLFTLSREIRGSIAGLISVQWPWAWRFALVASISMGVAVVWIPSAFVSLVTVGATIGLLYCGLMLPLMLQPPLNLYFSPRVTAALRRLPTFLIGVAS